MSARAFAVVVLPGVLLGLPACRRAPAERASEPLPATLSRFGLSDRLEGKDFSFEFPKGWEAKPVEEIRDQTAYRAEAPAGQGRGVASFYAMRVDPPYEDGDMEARFREAYADKEMAEPFKCVPGTPAGDMPTLVCSGATRKPHVHFIWRSVRRGRDVFMTRITTSEPPGEETHPLLDSLFSLNVKKEKDAH